MFWIARLGGRARFGGVKLVSILRVSQDDPVSGVFTLRGRGHLTLSVTNF